MVWWSGFFLASLVWGAVFGWIGVLIAKNKGASPKAGFWLGAFLGPIGLVIVALLSPPQEEQQPQQVSPAQTFEGPRELTNDAYKLWLTSHYEIKRNDVLDSYVCGDRLFPTVQSALEHAKAQDEAAIAAAEAEERRMADQREALEQGYRAYQETADEVQPWLVGAAILLALVLCATAFYLAA